MVAVVVVVVIRMSEMKLVIYNWIAFTYMYSHFMNMALAFFNVHTL